jgi:excisionase family DNA binding protein
VEDVGRLLTAAQVAERLGYTERYVWRLGREGVLPRIKLPGRKYVRFAERDVDRFVTRHRRDAVAAPRGAAAARPVFPARRF